MTSETNLIAGYDPAARWHSIVSRGGDCAWFPDQTEWTSAAAKHVEAIRQRTREQHDEWYMLNRRVDAGFAA
jgi:hypothetical protein